MKSCIKNFPTRASLFFHCSFFLIVSLPAAVVADQLPDTGVNPANIDTILEGFENPETEQPGKNSVEEILQAFDDEIKPQTDIDSPSLPAPMSRSIFDSKNFLQLSTVYNYAHEKPLPGFTDYRGLSRYRLKLQSEVSADINSEWKAVVSFFAYYDAIYEINERDEYSQAVLDSYESETELLDTYIQGSVTSSTDIKLGRQIIAWGNSENVRVVDVLNPLDIREPGMTDIADLRLPVTAVRLDYYAGDWSLSMIAIPEIRFNKIPPYGSDFYPGIQPPAPEIEIDDGGSNTEYAIALKGIFQGWDLSFHGAEYYDDEAHHEFINGRISRVHSKLKMLGVSANGTSGNWLVKTELAKIFGLEFFSDPDNDYSRVDLLIGVEYSGISDAVLSIESVVRRIDQFRDVLITGPDKTDRDSYQTVLRFTGSYLNDRLDITAAGSFYGKETKNGYFYRLSADYEIISALVFTFGVVTYHSGEDPFFQAIKDNDRIFLDFTYNF
jgi:hypothetical protein